MKKKIGEWILDVTKYLVTAGLAAPFFRDVNDWPWTTILFVALLILLMTLIGLSLAAAEAPENKSNEVNQKKVIKKRK